MVNTVPDWVSDAVFYQILPDRFARSNLSKPANLEPWEAPPTALGFKGGDLGGVREHLDYLTDLGVTALYLNPIFASTANHRYHTHDYWNVDPLLGGNEAFRRLLTEAQGRGMRVIIDGVFNHASRGFFQFNHTLENGLASPYLDWFHFNQEMMREGRSLDAYGVKPPQHLSASSMERYGYASWWDMPALPKFNTANPEVRGFLLSVAEHWINFGADGWRLDVPAEIDDDVFWREFRRRVKAQRADAYIVGEIWEDASRWLQGDQFDGAINYLFAKACLGFCFGKTLNKLETIKSGYKDIEALSGHGFAQALLDLWQRYPRAATFCQMNLLGSHDTPRLLNVGMGDIEGTKLAFLCLFTFPGAPCLYYGDEIGLAGGHDPDNRRGFDWDRRMWQQELYRYVRSLAHLRRSSLALRRGDFACLEASEESVVFVRSIGKEMALIAMNIGTTTATIEVTVPTEGNAEVVFKGERGGTEMVTKQAKAQLVLAPRSGQVFLGVSDKL